MEGRLVLSRYQILRRLGEGGMGVVYEAEDTRLPRKVAIKVLSDAAAGADARARLKREARAASALNHPNIVTVHDIESTDERDFIVMELVEGESLAALLGRGRLPLATIIEYAAAMAGAFGAAHAAGIVHRDIKPGNVMVTADGRIKVLDFGLAKVTRAAAPTDETASLSVQTRDGAVMGTLAYMSPEQAVGDPVDARSDVFSLGIVLYEMLTGQRPFQRDSSAGTVRAILNEQPRSLTELRRETPAALHAVVERCLRKDPGARYAHALDLKHDLEALRAPAARRSTGGYAAAAALLIVMAGVGAWQLSRTHAARDRAAVLAAIDADVDAGRLATALQRAQDLERKFPDDPEIIRTLDAFTMRRDLITEPEGAQIEVRDYGVPDSEWIPVGAAPLTNVRVPFASTQWRVTKDGYRPYEARFMWAFRPSVHLTPVDKAIAGTVFIPAGRTAESDGSASVPVPAFWLDTFEVTNRAYKGFVDAGGYRERKFWRQPFVHEGKTLEWGAAMARFVDRTGRAGPATWEAGAYPDGHAEMPVSGVSWYEAAAYAEFIGARLPSVAHRQRAMGPLNLSEDAKFGNFEGRGVRPVTQLRDLGVFGTFGLAGNVQEWCWNATDGRRFILGGGWNDPPYMMTRLEAKPPMDRADVNGFRTMRPADPLDERLFDDVPILEAATAGAERRPVSDETFTAYRGFYAYDKGPLDAKLEWTEQTDLWRRERVSVAAAYGGERVPIDLLLPAGGRPPYQAVIWYPGSYSLDLRSSREITAPMYFDFIVKSGRAVILPVFKGFYERGLTQRRPQGTARRDVFVERSKDLGRTIDYLESRDDIDTSRLGYYAFSAAVASIPLVALESRLKTAVFLSAGLPAQVTVPEIDPVNFLPRIVVPTLLMAGKHDVLTPVESSQQALFERLGTPAEHKKHYIYDGAHVPPRGLLIRELLEWLDKYLGGV